MPTTNERGHTVPLPTGEAPTRASIFGTFDTVNDVILVGDVTDRSTKVAGLSYTPSPSRPVIVFRADAPAGRELEYTTNGVDWYTVGTVGAFAPYAMAAGVTAVTSAGASTATAIVSLPPGRFTQPPIVVPETQVPVSGGILLGAGAVSITTTSFELRLRSASGAGFTGTFEVSWIATQMTAAASAG